MATQLRILDTNLIFQPLTVITASSEDILFPASNLSLYLRSKVWRSIQGVTSANIVFDLGSALNVDSFCIFWDLMRGNPLTLAATITIQANATNVWTAPSISQVVTPNIAFNCASFFWSSSQAFRYWRILITDPTNPLLRLEISKIVLSQATQLSHLPADTFDYVLHDQSKSLRNDYGAEYIDIYPVVKELDISYQSLSYADIKTLQSIYNRVGCGIPIVVAIDPFGSLYDPNHFLFYCKFPNKMNPKQTVNQYFDYDMKFLEAA